MISIPKDKLPEIPPAQTPPPSRRIMAVDALRGFDMFWILGVDSIAVALHRMTQNPAVVLMAYELDHSVWDGFRFYDLIFPLFVFIAGVSLVFSLGKTIAIAGRAEAVKRIFRRSILLFIFGLIYSGGVSHPWPAIRLMGVLQRTALAYFFAGLLFCFFKPRTLVVICAGLLLGYWGLLALTPIRDVAVTKINLAAIAQQSGDADAADLLSKAGRNMTPETRSAADKIFYGTTKYTTGKFDAGLNLTNHIDFQYLPGNKYDTFYDPEGLLSTMTAVATCLLGVFAGLLLQDQKLSDTRKVIWLLSFGAGAVLVGWLWGIEFPVIKKIWTSSYVLVAGGYSALLLGAFYWIVEVRKYQAWCQPFVWVGMNPITLYLIMSLPGGGFESVALRFCGGDVENFFDNHVAKGSGDLLIVIGGMLLAFLLAHFLYKRKIFLRV